jgi:uncharacterized protein YbaR (Trm112 family)
MKTRLLDLLVCPICLPREEGLSCHISEKHGDDILSGCLECNQCGTEYPIQEGIASLLPIPAKENEQTLSKYESPTVVSSYLWSHFGDLLGDKEATTAYREWAELIQGHTGFSLDAGCATGRLTFEMSHKCDFAVGIDNSHAFIRAAREFMKNRQLGFSMTLEGLITEDQIIQIPEKWRCDRMEFIVGDAQSLPFQSSLFSSVASLNLVDKLPQPLAHLREMNRIATETQAQFLFTDPFSWSTEIAREEDWLGGTTSGPYIGRGMDNIISLLTGEEGRILPPWKIEKEGHIWWKIRNHRNHFELIRSCFVKAGR